MATNNILFDLFAQILHSEEKVKERTAKLKRVNEDIENIQAKTVEIMEEIKSFQGDQVIKNQRIAEQELQFKWFTKKRQIFAEQKAEMGKKKKELLGCLKKVNDDSDNKRNRFLKEAEQFSAMYDLINDGRKKREIEKNKKLEEFILEKEKLRTEIDTINKVKNEISFLEYKKEKLLFQINELESKQKGVTHLIRSKMEKTEQLEIEKNKVSQKPQSDQEFQRILSELQSCKENGISLEGICDALRQELEELQQSYYQKQLRKQKRQRQQQHKQPQQQQQQQQQQEKKQQNEQRWQRQQFQQQNQMNTEEKKSGFEHVSNTQDKRIQRPLFEENATKARRLRQYDIDQTIDTTNPAASTTRLQEASKKPRFQY